MTSLVAEELRRRRAPGNEHEVYNFCLPGFNTASEVALYERVARHFQPDALVLVYYLNDVNLPPELFVRPREWKPERRAAWRAGLRLVEWVDYRLGRARARSEFIAGVRRAHEPGHPGFESVVAGFVASILRNLLEADGRVRSLREHARRVGPRAVVPGGLPCCAGE